MSSATRDVAELEERMRAFRIETDTSDATSTDDGDDGAGSTATRGPESTTFQGTTSTATQQSQIRISDGDKKFYDNKYITFVEESLKLLITKFEI